MVTVNVGETSPKSRIGRLTDEKRYIISWFVQGP